MMIGGLDVGTTGCKISVYDRDAGFVKTYYREYDASHTDGRHEINFEDVRNAVFQLLKSAAQEYRISALGITSFGETFAMLDENDGILAPSMLYTDPRGGEECQRLCETFGEDWLTLRTGVRPHQMYSISKILWYQNREPDLFAKCKRILLGQDFIVYTLTGRAQIDYSLAARTAAFDIEQKRWIQEIFEKSGIDMGLMSDPVPSGSLAGNLKETVKEALGIDYDMAIVNGCHDQVAAMIGSGVFDSRSAMDGTGTVECIPVLLKEKPLDLGFYAGGYSVVPYITGDYACYALLFTGGAALKWFRDCFAEAERAEARQKGENVYALLDSRIGDKPTGILVLPHFAGAATPYMDNDSKAAFLGITLETGKYDLYRAIMEGTTYEMLLNFNTMKAFTGEIETISATGGGANSDVWLQIKADILNMRILALDCGEVGAAGTAALTGTAVGAYGDLRAAVSRMVSVRKVVEPNPANVAFYSALYQKYANLYRAVKEL